MPRIPKYPARPHVSGHARITVDGKSLYLGRWGSPESHREYARVVASLAERGRRRTREPVTVGHLCDLYLVHAEGYYTKRGTPTAHVRTIQNVLGRLRRLYGASDAESLDQSAIKAVRASWAAQGLARPTVNNYVTVVVECLRWAAEEGLVSVGVAERARSVRRLRRGRSPVPDRPDIPAATEDDLERIAPHTRPEVAAMMRVQALTGMRPGEVTAIRVCDLDMGGAIWCFNVPDTWNKEAHKGRERLVRIGPAAQAILRVWIARAKSPTAYLFRPPGRNGLPGAPKYSGGSYSKAIRHACRRAGIEGFGANRIRKLAGERIERAVGPESGLDVARAALGHADAATTRKHYSMRRDLADVDQVMREIG
jgi:integrase